MEDNNSSVCNKRKTQDKIYTDIKEKIELGDIEGAEELLELVTKDARNAEWHFLKGCILTHNGWFHDAQVHFDTAHTLDPDDAEYAEAAKSLNTSANCYVDTWSKENEEECDKEKRKKALKKDIICTICTEGCCECLCEGICGICDGI